MFGRQTTGSVVCTSCGRLVGVNDETCYNCGRRNPGLWGFGPAPAQARQRPRVRAADHVGIDGAVRGDAAHVGQRHPDERRLLVPGAEHDEPVPVRRKRRHAGLPVRPVVDGPQRGVAAQRRPAHPVQHDVGAAARAGVRRDLRPRPDGDHLHRGRGHGIRRQFVRVAVLRGHPDSGRRRVHRRGLGGHLRPARGHRVVRPAFGQQHGQAGRPPVRAHDGHVRPDHAWHRQLGSRRRVRRRLADGEDPRPAQAGADGSPRAGGRLRPRDGAVNRGVHPPRLLALRRRGRLAGRRQRGWRDAACHPRRSLVESRTESRIPPARRSRPAAVRRRPKSRAPTSRS